MVWDTHGVQKSYEGSTAAGVCRDGPWPRPARCSSRLLSLCNGGAQRSAHGRCCHVLASGLVGGWPCRWPSCVPLWWNGQRGAWDHRSRHQACDRCPHHCHPTRRPRGHGQLPWHWNNKNNSKVQFIHFSVRCVSSHLILCSHPMIGLKSQLNGVTEVLFRPSRWNLWPFATPTFAC